MMKDYFEQSMRALQLAGMSKSTQDVYTRSVRMLVEFYDKTPDLITEKELQDYFLHRKNVDKWAATTLRICYSGIKFFFINVLKREWHTLALVNAKRDKSLPVVLSVDEVRRILGAVTSTPARTYLTTVYSCGLRLSEGLNLQVKDIDSQRMRIHVHRGKGAKTAMFLYPIIHWRCCATIGRRTVIRTGFSQSSGTVGQEGQPPPNRWTPLQSAAAFALR
jgi:site-specific recombinase XerD